MPLVGYFVLFTVVGVGFILVHLLVGKLIRPAKPDPDKLTIYECGEPTIGSAWIQFDLRFYVVALLFVIFDVEVAFFFPWAVVFGKANSLANMSPPQTVAQQERYNNLVRELVPPYPENQTVLARYQNADALIPAAVVAQNQATARRLAWLSLGDILVFFGVLLVGFAYLWKRGDLNWVRSLATTQGGMAELEVPAPPEQELVETR
ncbi:MAG: NADH-quinone oxidoreductase subunit A [Gemmataceae bacterium]